MNDIELFVLIKSKSFSKIIELSEVEENEERQRTNNLVMVGRKTKGVK